MTVVAWLSRQHKLLQTGNGINLRFHSIWELVTLLHGNLVISFTLVDPAEAPLKLFGLNCSQVSMQTGMCPLWFAAGIARPKHGLALATGLQAAPMLCHWVLGVPAARQGLMGLSLSFPTQAEGKAVLITGCDKGFGHALAKQLHAKGFTVFAGCLLAVSSNIDQNSSLLVGKMLLKQHHLNLKPSFTVVQDLGEVQRAGIMTASIASSACCILSVI